MNGTPRTTGLLTITDRIGVTVTVQTTRGTARVTRVSAGLWRVEVAGERPRMVAIGGRLALVEHNS